MTTETGKHRQSWPGANSTRLVACNCGDQIEAHRRLLLGIAWGVGFCAVSSTLSPLVIWLALVGA